MKLDKTRMPTHVIELKKFHKKVPDKFCLSIFSQELQHSEKNYHQCPNISFQRCSKSLYADSYKPDVASPLPLTNSTDKFSTTPINNCLTTFLEVLWFQKTNAILPVSLPTSTNRSSTISTDRCHTTPIWTNVPLSYRH